MTICLVEDEFLLRDMAQADLEDLGFEVIPAQTCEEAWAMIAAAGASGRRFDCLLTDIRTPGAFDGWELARRTRALDPAIAVIYVSGFAGGRDEPVEGSIFLPKPYLCQDLARALGQLGVAPGKAAPRP